MPSSSKPGGRGAATAGQAGQVLAVGLRATVRATVTEADTAEAMGSGDVPVLATPRLLALAEAAAIVAVGPSLGAGLTSVGTSVSLEHRLASPLGADIDVEAELTEVDGRRLVFSFIARAADTDEDVVIGAGTIERVVLDRARFIARAGSGPGARAR